MGKTRTTSKRMSSASQSASNSIDIKARKRIEQLYELTDEIINAYNEINEKYVHQIYRKYRQLQETNKKLKEKLTQHHCIGCKCQKILIANDNFNDEDEKNQTRDSTLPSSTTKSVHIRRRSQNPFIISDIEETQNFDANDSRFQKNTSDDEVSMDAENHQPSSDENNDDEVDGEDNGMTRLPLVLQKIIRRKAKNRRNPKPYLLEIPRYPTLCEYLRDKSEKSFNTRPTDIQVRPFIEKHISKISVADTKYRMNIRSELREIHRSYLRTFIDDPNRHTTTTKLSVKKSPM